ncbi:MAG TPA: M15 family metallopeptidase [Papillibacter sp.]|jgi:hypothetical protein|nr:M15 family metallopeptidase [Papillibacter sp.]
MFKSRDIGLLRPDVAENCRILIALAKEAGRSVLVTETVRDDEYQAYLYAQGRTRPGAIITNSPVPTFHSVKAGLAFDICQNVKGREYNDEGFWKIVGAIGKKIGFTWGGDWKTIVDKPHFQWDGHGAYTSGMILSGQYPPPMPRYKEDEEMTQEQFDAFYEKINPFIRTFGDVPDWMKPEVRKLLDAEIINGGTPKAENPDDINMRLETLKAIVVAARMRSQ